MDIGTILLQWEGAGVFEYLLPFLLVFAIVFGIMSATNLLGSNRGVHVIISLIIGLMAIGYSYSTGFSLGEFMRTLFPKLGIGLSVLLALLILIGMFISDNESKYWAYGLGAIGAVIAIIIISQTFSQFSWYTSGLYGDYVGWIIGAVLLIGIIIAVSSSGGPKSGSKHSGKFVPFAWTPPK